MNIIFTCILYFYLLRHALQENGCLSYQFTWVYVHHLSLINFCPRLPLKLSHSTLIILPSLCPSSLHPTAKFHVCSISAKLDT